MKGLLITLLLFPVVVFAALTPESATKGTPSDSDWQSIFLRVASGDKNWLAIVPALALKVDRQQANQLEDALATALPINTNGVLAVLRTLDSVADSAVSGTNIVCGLKVVKPGRQADAYYTDTRLALLDEPEGAQCLWNLEGVWEEVRQAKNDRRLK